MKRIHPTLASALSIPLVLWGSVGCAPEPIDRPNVVLIVLDTLRADQLTAYGQAKDRAPYLTQLAQRSVVFENAFSSSSWTAPSTASLLTGTYDDRHGVEEGFLVQLQRGVKQIDLPTLSPATPTLAQVLQRNGYTTFGLTANINIGPEMKFDRGFDHFERQHEWTAQGVFKKVRQWKEQILGADPYFLYMHLNDVHKPYRVRERWYEAEGGKNEDAFARYKSELGFMDSFLARIHKLLAWGDDDLVVVVSDHGEEFYEHGDWGHHFTLYGEVNRIVFMIHGPGHGIAAGRISTEASIVDVGPTLLDLVDIPAPVDGDGVSWARELRDANGWSPGRTLFAHRIETNGELWSAISNGWKLIEGMPNGPELYQLTSDPGETKNLAGERPQELALLSEALAQHKRRAPGVKATRQGVPLDEDLLKHLNELGYVDD